MRRVPVVHVVAIVGIALGVFVCAMLVLAAGKLLQDLSQL
jgi:hypothetical protein